MNRRVALVILDGWGIGREDDSNPIFTAELENVKFFRERYATGALQASGIAVGLPWGEEGNSEVGHLTIGAGKVIYQHYPRITIAIESGDFFKNPALAKAFQHVKQFQSAVHLVSILSESNVHASLDHLRAVLQAAKQERVSNVYLHAISDGKDSAPQSFVKLLDRVEGFMREIGVGRTASVMGRYYAMDRDEHWSRTERATLSLLGKAPIAASARDVARNHYRENLGDEFLVPTLIGPEPRTLRANDALIFLNYREDSMRQIASVFLLPEFDKFARQAPAGLFGVTMTRYSEAFSAEVAFPQEQVAHPLGRVLADSGKSQIRIAETEKYAHVTYFFNGYREQPFTDEYRILVPSKTVVRADQAPEMMAREVANRLIESIDASGADFFLANFANADVLGHTGNVEATIAGVRAVDAELGKILRIALEREVTLIVTADHGNAERMRDPVTGVPENKHNPNPVPIYFIAPDFERQKSERGAVAAEREVVGVLSDVAPTVLELMGISKPSEMTGESLVRLLR